MRNGMDQQTIGLAEMAFVLVCPVSGVETQLVFDSVIWPELPRHLDESGAMPQMRFVLAEETQ